MTLISACEGEMSIHVYIKEAEAVDWLPLLC